MTSGAVLGACCHAHGPTDAADADSRSRTRRDAATAVLASCECSGVIVLTDQVEDDVENDDKIEQSLRPFRRHFVSWPRGDTPELDDDAVLERDPSGRLSDYDYSNLLHRGAPDAMIQRWDLEWTYEAGIVAMMDFSDGTSDDEMLLSGEIGMRFDMVQFHLGRVVLVDGDDLDGSRFMYQLYHFVERQHLARDSPKHVFNPDYRWVITAPDADGPCVPIIKLTRPIDTSRMRTRRASTSASDASEGGQGRGSGDAAIDESKPGSAGARKFVRAIVSDDEDEADESSGGQRGDSGGGNDELMSDDDDKAAVSVVAGQPAIAPSPWSG